MLLIKTDGTDQPRHRRQRGGGGGGGGSGTTARLPLIPDQLWSIKAGGNISLGDEASAKYPSWCLAGTDEIEVSITKVTPAPAAPQDFRLLGAVYEFRVRHG